MFARAGTFVDGGSIGMRFSMQQRLLLAISMTLFITQAAQARQGVTRQTELNEKTYPAIRKALNSQPVETHWKEIPWRPNFGEAIEEARKADKPILLWMMNGHPCGMT